MAVKRRKIVVLDDVLPSPQYGYGYPRSEQVLLGLQEVVGDVLLVPAFQISSGESGDASARLRGHGIQVAAPIGEPHRIAQLADEVGADAVLASRPRNLRMAHKVMRTVSRRPLLIYDTEAISGLRSLAQCAALGLPRDEAEQALAQELSMIAEANVRICVSELERRYLVDRGMTAAMLGHVHAIRDHAPGRGSRDHVLFVAGYFGLMQWGDVGLPPPNLDALRVFLDEILPRFRVTHPTVPVVIAGIGSELAVERILDGAPLGPHVHVAGAVPDLAPYYERAILAIAPTRYAAGLAWKVTEALSEGVPVVTSALIAAQLPGEVSPVLASESPAELAGQMALLCDDRAVWYRQQQIGSAHAHRHYSAAAFRTQIHELAVGLSAEEQRP